MEALHVEVLGRGPRLLLVHGSVTNGALTWGRQRPLADRFQLVVPDRRGFPPNPDVDRVDFDDEADWLLGLLDPPAHLCGHSYGGLVCLLAAARRPEAVRSLTVIEPPALAVARGNPAVDAFVAAEEEIDLRGPRDPEAHLRRFLRLVGSGGERLPSPLPPDLAQGARTLMVERLPSEAEVPLAALAAASFPKLVVSGAHSAALDAVCDVLERELAAERAVFPGRGHGVQLVGEPFNERLADFVERAEGRAGVG